MQRFRHGSGTCPIYITLISGVNVPPDQGYRPNVPRQIVDVIKKKFELEKHIPDSRSQLSQTLYREDETQTEPFLADIKTPYDKGLELLTMGWLSWKNGLPAGMREAVAIERARQRRSWEKALPSPVNSDAKEIRNIILEALELNQLNYRESELAAIASVALKNTEKSLRDDLIANRKKNNERLSRYIRNKVEEREGALKKTEFKIKRDMRKLRSKWSGASRKYKKMDILMGLNDKTSEFYGPQERFGVHPKRVSQVIPPEFRFWNVFSHAELLNLEIPDYVATPPGFDYVKKSISTKKYKELCIKETKWTERYLEKLHNLLKVLRLQKSERHNFKLRTVKPRPQGPLITSYVVGIPDEEDALFQCTLYLQKTIKGRAIQAVAFEGRVKCQNLIDELKSTHTLLDHIEDIHDRLRRKSFDYQRTSRLEALQNLRKHQILSDLAGETVSEILDFLSKELLRLENERETHRLALSTIQNRHKREAEEAGRRQLEEKRGRELDEINKQITKICQNSVDLTEEAYAERVRKIVSTEYGRMKAEEYSRKIDIAAREADARESQLKQDEIIADLIHNFALPEVEKEIVRTRLRDRQRSILSACHEEIYSKIEQVSRFPRSLSGNLLSLPNEDKPNPPPLHRIKLVRLDKAQSFESIDEDSETIRTEESRGSESMDASNTDDENWSTGFSHQEVILQ